MNLIELESIIESRKGETPLQIIQSLGDSQKIEIVKSPELLLHYSLSGSYYQREIMLSVSDNQRKAFLQTEADFIKDNLDNYNLSIIIASCEDDAFKEEMIDKYNIENALPILKSFSDNNKTDILESDRYELYGEDKIDLLSTLSANSLLNFIQDHEDFIQENSISLYQITRKLNGEDQIEFVSELEKLDLSIKERQQILATLSEEAKSEIDTSNFSSEDLAAISIFSYEKNNNDFKKCDLGKIFNAKEIISILQTIDVNGLLGFIQKYKDFFKENNIPVYEFTRKLSTKDQINFISEFENLGLSLYEKRQILVTLNEITKNQIDTSSFPEEYISALDISIPDASYASKCLINVDYDKDFKIYEGLDDFIRESPQSFDDTKRKKFLDLCTICPNLKIKDDYFSLASPTLEEYTSAEIWIQSVLDKINDNWSTIKKIAYIDNQIGKKISYTPENETEVDNKERKDAWNVVNSGYGICSEVANLEKYMLNRIGIKNVKMISTGKHAFLKLENIELSTEKDGPVLKSTIIDPTWNLADHRFGDLPMNFCRSYEEIRKHDIGSETKIDYQCHLKDDELSDCTSDLDLKTLRSIYSDLGIADKDGNFPIKVLIDKVKLIDNPNNSGEEFVRNLFSLVESYYPDLAKCQQETMYLLETFISNAKCLETDQALSSKKFVINRVYDRSDEEKKAVVFVYCNFQNEGKKFFYLDKDKGKFLNLTQKDFEERFECYQSDIKENNGYRLWDDNDQQVHEKDLAMGSRGG